MRIIRHWQHASVLFLILAIAYSKLTAQSQADIDAGKQLFQGMCVECHGEGGAGGEAPSLNRARLLHAPTDEALIKILTNGIPNTGMPRVRRFTDNELRQLVIYVRSLGKVASTAVSGNSTRGAAVYKNLGCAGCHIVNGIGGEFGPDLSDIGFRRGASYLREAVLNPGESLPKGTLQVPGRGYAEFLPVHIVTGDGKDVRGIRVNEDAFTIQVRDQAGKFYSFRKNGLKALDKQIGQSLMPSFRGKLTPADLTDLVAYLSSLRSDE